MVQWKWTNCLFQDGTESQQQRRIEQKFELYVEQLGFVIFCLLLYMKFDQLLPSLLFFARNSLVMCFLCLHAY